MKAKVPPTFGSGCRHLVPCAVVLLCNSILAYSSAPNIVLLVVESTHGKTWTPGYSNGALPLPNLDRLARYGTRFTRHYANSPVCCPSRATLWSGRHVHNLPHAQSGTKMHVGGVWNNHEGLARNYTDRIDQVLARSGGGYNIKMSGKLDYTTGGHTVNAALEAWTMYVDFPYNISRDGGWNDEGDVCASRGVVRKGSGIENSAHEDDWNTLQRTVEWINENVGEGKKPAFVYQGMNIVHPPYLTSEEWFAKIDASKVTIPSWVPLDKLHPCDLQSSMLKGCTPSDASYDAFHDHDRIRRIRRIYLAMIAEFDAMVGAYVDAIEAVGASNDTIFIVTSDHGDMQLEHQQFYKMTPYDGSSSVPMIIYDPRHPTGGIIAIQPTQHVDLFPTIMQLAGVPRSAWPAHLDGHSLLPILRGGTSMKTGRELIARPDFVVSQFHGDNVAMSWFLVVQQLDGIVYKYIVWGTGNEVEDQLFNLCGDPDEETNLALDPSHKHVVAALEASLRSVVDYAVVAQEVATYNHESFVRWTSATPNWETKLSSLRWHSSWNANATGSLAAVKDWVLQEPRVKSCRRQQAWPSPSRPNKESTSSSFGFK